jgi:hypothetical protein
MLEALKNEAKFLCLVASVGVGKLYHVLGKIHRSTRDLEAHLYKCSK